MEFPIDVPHGGYKSCNPESKVWLKVFQPEFPLSSKQALLAENNME
jgi:hypothetical protein